jgi:Zn-dependent protease
MTPTRQGSFRLFRFKGIDVHMHWSWLIVAVISVSNRAPDYTAPVWALFEYLALFLIVLLHEFGHALACRQVGGTADQIVLWPLGGVAYVTPPQRPGATLWSLAAGPLVNVVLLPVFFGVFYACGYAGAYETNHDLYHFLRTLVIMDLGLLIFNLLPVYPLDGGQIVRSLLWFPLGRARSLKVSTIIGFIGGAGLVALAVWEQSLWMGIMAFYLGSICWRGFQQAGALRRLEQLPRRPEFKCVSCHASPPTGSFWLCPSCRQAFDPFATASVCPHCSTPLALITCPDCHQARALKAWDASIRDA